MKSGKQAGPRSRVTAIQPWWWLALLVVAAFIAYQPAWHGTLLWDDPGHITKPALRTTAGLWRIWTELGAAQQYYPVTHTAFWLLHRVFGDGTTAYHLVTIALHALTGVLLYRLLARLAVPGALVAATAFVLHPVHVESVAWISEIKNTLSGVFFLSAALVYQRFDDTRSPRAYAGALGLFVLAILSKAVTVTLPAVLLVVIWWRRGRIDWRTDVLPLLGWLLVALPQVIAVSYVERTFIGATGREFVVAFHDRVLIAARAVVFYAGKLLWPSDLVFVYPKWAAPTPSWVVYPAVVLAALTAAWFVRARTRGPLTVLLLFIGILTPALGFVNAFPFRYSYVADHFQYLASMPILALIGVLAVRAAGSFLRPAAAVTASVIVLGVPLGVATWRQAHHYADVETLYRETLRSNPGAWMAHLNLGVELQERGDIEAAVGHFQSAVALYPHSAEGYVSLGAGLRDLGRNEEARAAFEEALRLEPAFPRARSNLGGVLLLLGEPVRAEQELRAALDLDPYLTEARYNLGNVLLQSGRHDAAVEAFRRTVSEEPDHAWAWNNLGLSYERLSRFEDAEQAYRASLARERSPTALTNHGYALLHLGRLPEAEAALRESLTREGRSVRARHGLGEVLLEAGRLDEAVAEFTRVLQQGAGAAAPMAHNNLGLALARLGRRSEARAHFQEALRLQPAFEAARQNLARAGG
jgi:tetratricopeptide (TPR) repeat protein